MKINEEHCQKEDCDHLLVMNHDTAHEGSVENLVYTQML